MELRQSVQNAKSITQHVNQVQHRGLYLRIVRWSDRVGRTETPLPPFVDLRTRLKMSAGCIVCVMTSVVKTVNNYKSSFSNNLVKVGICGKEYYLTEKYRSSVFERPLLSTFFDFRCRNFNCVFLTFSKIWLPAETCLQSAVSPVCKINENFFHQSKLHFIPLHWYQ